MFKLFAIVAAATITLNGTAFATTLDFEELPGFVQLTAPIRSFESQDYRLTATSGEFVSYAPTQVRTVPESGSTFLGVTGNTLTSSNPANSSFTLSRIDGLGFDLVSFRAAEGRNNGQFFPAFSSTGLTLVATFMNGTSLSQNILFDGIATDNAATDFEAFNFANLTNLRSFTFTGFGGTRGGFSFSLDDIAVNQTAPIPLPAGLPLLLAGLGGLVVIRRRRKA